LPKETTRFSGVPSPGCDLYRSNGRFAAHISRAGVCAELLEDLLLHHELVISAFILEELRRKLGEKFNFPKREADQVAAFLRRVGIVVSLADLPSDLCRDPRDLQVLGMAVAGQCALLISVDLDLLDMRSVHEVPIIRPGEFWRRNRNRLIDGP
jgi:predicted nucleic acid-binding protein